MTIDISNNNPRVSYAVAQGATQTSFTVNFEFFENADLNVYVDGTKKSLTTHYTVSGGSGSTGTVTMSVTGTTGGSTVVITRDTTIERTTDFSAGADINRAALNTQLDTLTAMVADIEDQASRAIQVSDYETAPSLELPSLDSRKGTVMGFNASTGAVEAGPKLADVSTLANITTDIATLADIEDGTDATDAIQTAASNSSNIATVAGVSGNVTTVAGISSNVTSVAGNATNINTVAGSISNVNTTASNISSVNTNATNISAIQGASGNASTATTKASEAATSATNAASSATSAATAQTAAESARDSALAAFDNFDDKYLGAKSSGPTVDNDGDALVAGALYFDTTAGAMQVYTGSAWVAAYASLSGALLVTNNLSDVNNAANSATNLGLGVGNTPTFNGINTTGDISFGDNDKAKFGSSNDLSIYHDASNSVIKDSGTGDLIIGADNNIILADAALAEVKALFTTNGAASLYYDNSSKLATTSNGISVSGKATAEFIDVGGNDTGAAGLINVYGGATGEGGEIKIYPSAANDTTIDSFSIDIAGDSLRIFDSNGDMHSQFVPNGAAELYHNGSKKFETSSSGIDVTGTVGINTSSPAYTIDATSAGNTQIHLKASGQSDGLEIGQLSADGGSAITATNNNYLKFGTNNTERMRINSSGNVGIGTSSSSPSANLDVGGVIRVTNTANSANYGTISDGGGLVINSQNNNPMYFYTGGSERMRLTSGGDLHVDGNVIAYSTTISDERLKEDIKPIEGALDKVGQLSGYTFTYKADGKQSAGVIAQEVEAVLPSAVTESTLPLKTDDDVEYKTVQYDQLHGLLIEAIKELKAEIEELKNGASS